MIWFFNNLIWLSNINKKLTNKLSILQNLWVLCDEYVMYKLINMSQSNEASPSKHV